MDSYMYLGIAGIFIVVGLLGFCLFAIREAMVSLRKRKLQEAIKEAWKLRGLDTLGNWYGAVVVSTGYEEVEEITANAQGRGCIVGKSLDSSETREFLGLEEDYPINTKCALVPVWLPEGLTITEATRNRKIQ